MELRTITVQVALELLDVIQPNLGSEPASAVVGEAKSGDYTFGIDEEAETALPEIIARACDSSGRRLAYYSEDRGLVSETENPEFVLIIDPIDGTRPAMCNFESCCVSVALAPLPAGTAGSQAPVVPLSAVTAACLIEIKTGQILSGERGRGLYLSSSTHIGGQVRIDGKRRSGKTGIQHLFWAHEVCGRPSAANFAVLGNLIDRSAFGGGCFVFSSSSFAISRIVLGQLDAYVDPFAALLRGTARDRWIAESRSLFHGRVFGLFPYDIAAAVLLAEEGGAIVSDARGRPLGDTNLLDSSEAAIMSCIAASNADLHEILVHEVSLGLRRAEGR